MFIMECPEYLIVKINNLRGIVLCADAPEENAPAPDGDGVYRHFQRDVPELLCI